MLGNGEKWSLSVLSHEHFPTQVKQSHVLNSNEFALISLVYCLLFLISTYIGTINVL